MVVQDAVKLGLYRMLEHRRINRTRWQAWLREPLDSFRCLRHAGLCAPSRL